MLIKHEASAWGKHLSSLEMRLLASRKILMMENEAVGEKEDFLLIENKKFGKKHSCVDAFLY